MLRRLGPLRGRRRPRGWRWWWRRLGLCQLDLLFHRWLGLRLRLGFWLGFGFWLRRGFLRQGLFLDLVRQDQLFFFLLWRLRWSRRGRSECRRGRRGRRRWRYSRRLRLLRRRLVRVTFFRDNAPDRGEDLLHRRFRSEEHTSELQSRLHL